MQTIRELAEQGWTGALDLKVDFHPVRVRRSRAEEVHERILVFSGLANSYAVDTGDGLVLLDAGHVAEAADLHARIRDWRPDTPLYGAVYSHHHVDHVFGVAPFDAEAAERGWPAPVVHAHADVVPHFDRYRATNGLNTALNRRQFAVDTPDFRWPDRFRHPDVGYRDRMAFHRGDLTFDLHHARGETDDATWTWIPELKAVHTGDLFIWALPNAGNPQKVQRYASDWAHALREMAALGAELLLPGHGLPVFGADRVRRACSETAELLESLEAQTLAAMNRGLPLDEVIHAVSVPAHLADRPYLQPVYDHPQFVVRNIWRRYGGWYDGEPDNLVPAPRDAQAREWVRLAGGVRSVLDRAAELHRDGDSRLACHLVEHAVRAAPDDADVHELRARIYAERAAGESSLMVRNILGHAAAASREGERDLASRG
ncbi:alkyl sulfatase BDS1-like metallo-beta-lactamase superfamily hydrolase [Spinactinospora alkalitolerans]|uniref:Alkyl sulfatase BDS1-like metallo-beta-lactamase superfamily hydrolase n=1 Tax=Spinactinospora alkalitolerans TaxID=687207 RepID=A0A852TUD5_9ACTN|nr:alkyl sulfatase dimerization domain-containing protein [Spinactinospora alkalitolerans]NYE47055.1 alkyl sulfatase BDS1-like metallo-beta-lactamase superfamily hydrolase [Spinactinospora alkalitolerans]